MKVAFVKASGKAIDYRDGTFSIDGQTITRKQIKEYSQLGVLEWVNDELRDYVLKNKTEASSSIIAPAPSSTTANNSDKDLTKYIAIAVGVLVIGIIGFITVTWYFEEVHGVQTGRVVEVLPQGRDANFKFIIVADDNSNRGHMAQMGVSRDVRVGDSVRFRLRDDSARFAQMGLPDIIVISIER